MDNESFVTTVEQAAGIGRERAERAIRATLSTLAERIAQGEARDLAEQLPPEVAPWLTTTDGAHRFDVDEFLGGWRSVRGPTCPRPSGTPALSSSRSAGR